MKLKDLTLDQVWALCIEMWEWIVTELQRDPKQQIHRLKVQWLEDHGYVVDDINSWCFFCGYSGNWGIYYDCTNCPARLVDPKFSCFTIEYQYNIRPGAFLLKIKELNERRLKDGL